MSYSRQISNTTLGYHESNYSLLLNHQLLKNIFLLFKLFDRDRA